MRRSQWSILVLLLSAVTINYIDRGSLSVAAPSIGREFALTDAERGWLLSAFFWTYSICQIGAGWLADRFAVKWVYASGFLLWSIATAATGLTTGFTGLLLGRLLLGVGESVTYPAGACILARSFSPAQRGFANGLVDAGSKIGPALSILVSGLLVESLGWRSLFIGLGLGSLLWLVPWVRFMPLEQKSASGPHGATPKLLEILARQETWGTSLGMFSLGYAWTFLITWLPSYLIEHRHLSTHTMAWAGSLPFWAMAITSVTGGWASDKWIAAGGNPSFVRKTFVVSGLFFCALFLVSVDLVSGTKPSLVLLIAASLSLGVFTSNVWAITQTLAGPSAAGKWAGVQNCIGNLGGVVAPALTGIVIQKTGSYTIAFGLASIVLLCGIGAYLTLVRKVAPLHWISAERETTDGRLPISEGRPSPTTRE